MTAQYHYKAPKIFNATLLFAHHFYDTIIFTSVFMLNTDENNKYLFCCFCCVCTEKRHTDTMEMEWDEQWEKEKSISSLYMYKLLVDLMRQ